MPKLSAGLLVYRRVAGRLEVLLVHPGGPFWAKRDEGSWSIPKGEYEPGEDPLEAAVREFGEELGLAPPSAADAVPLGEVRQASGKRVSAWALEGDVDVDDVRSNTFPMEWPPRSGRIQEMPEVDRAGWFDLETARRKLLKGQAPLLDRLPD
jgi:predicted NUDIX family NTP pyrophosphohydrolase